MNHNDLLRRYFMSRSIIMISPSWSQYWFSEQGKEKARKPPEYWTRVKTPKKKQKFLKTEIDKQKDTVNI